MHNFSTVSALKEHEYKVLMEFIPVSFMMNVLAVLERIEKDSGSPSGGLVRAEWAKQLERRHTNQCTAHLKLFYNSIEAANYAI